MSKGIDSSELEILADAQKGFPHREKLLARTLGISRSSLREIRADRLMEHTDWEIVQKRCCLSDDGVLKVENFLNSSKNGPGQSDPCPATAPAPKIAPGMDSGPLLPQALLSRPEKNGDRDVLLEVHRANFLNHRLIEAFRPGSDPSDRANLLRVRVASSANFVAGMLIPCRHLELDYYELARPCPRWRGRW